ncbi:MAG TPA: hypothetical protein VMT16_06045 [Thermoanaerobaculia bacterium]|nr:hypothetical protein [Thermoanaerobaculia bacterium]
MLLQRNTTRRRVRRAVKTTKRALNDALDRAEPGIERAAEALEELGRDGIEAARSYSRQGATELRKGYSRVESQVMGMGRKGGRKLSRKARRNPGKAALIVAGVAVIALGMLSR